MSHTSSSKVQKFKSEKYPLSEKSIGIIESLTYWLMVPGQTSASQFMVNFTIGTQMILRNSLISHKEIFDPNVFLIMPTPSLQVLHSRAWRTDLLEGIVTPSTIPLASPTAD